MDLEHVRGDGQMVLRAVLHTLPFQHGGHPREHPSPTPPRDFQIIGLW